MSQSTTIAKRIWDLFAASKPVLREAYQNNPDIKDKLEIFSPFMIDHVKRAGNYTRKYASIAAKKSNDGSGILDALDQFSEDLKNENPDLLYFSLDSFLNRYKGDIPFVIPPIQVREPESILPSQEIKQESLLEFVQDDPVEREMNWFREDPSLNEHHSHWHIVYDADDPKDRQGEMFFYMHQQMIARYDADRIASGLPRVEPFDNMQTQLISSDYTAGDDTRLARLPNFRARPMNQKVGNRDAKDQVDKLKLIKNDIASGRFKPSHPQKPEAETKAVDNLGNTIEANRRYDNTRGYINYHGDGHIAIGNLNAGVMLRPVAAIRDAIFWEWHKGVDDIYYTLQETFEPFDFSQNDPKISLRKMVKPNNEPYSADLILCNTKDIPGDPAVIGEAAFGGNNWERDFAQGNFTVNTDTGPRNIITVNALDTFMKAVTITYKNPNGTSKTYKYPYLTHEPFTYFIRVENRNMGSKNITFRIFMAPAANSMDRRSWIEMDKFVYTIPGNSKKVIARKDTLASVVKKPADGDPLPDDPTFDPLNIPITAGQCSCGWPYRMLLPKGRGDGGMEFTLMVMITDGDLDGLGTEKNCGSVSFCAANSNKYPDKLPLGFPFNRKFAGNGNGIRQMLINNKNVISRNIRIVHHPQI